MATFVPFLIKAFPPAPTTVDYCTDRMSARLFCRKVGADNGSRAGRARQRSAGRVTRTGRGKKERGGELTLKQHNKETTLRSHGRLHFMFLNNSPS